MSRCCLLVGLLISTLPLLTIAVRGEAPATPEKSLNPVLGNTADWSWKVESGTFEVSKDDILKKEVLTVSCPTNAPAVPLLLMGQTRYSTNIQICASVRMRTGTAPSSLAILSFGVTNAADPGICLTLNRAANVNSIYGSVSHGAKPFHDIEALMKKLNPDWLLERPSAFEYKVRAYDQYLPGWQEDFRAQVESDMGSVADADNHWVAVRAELARGAVRLWVDDRLVAAKEDPELNPEGAVRMNLYPGVQLGKFELQRIADPRGFQLIPLGGYVNAGKLLGDASVDPTSLPPAGKVTPIEGIPFAFPGANLKGEDHLDIGRSLFRQANLVGYFQSQYGNLSRWNGALTRDPARIQVRIPNGQYDALYLVAASDDGKNRVPQVTAMFYRPNAGYAENFTATVPLATAKSSDLAKPVPVTLRNGRKVNLWLVKIPLDPGVLSAFADMDILEIELTKEVRLWRSYPDPISYSYHQAGPPSAVHIYAATLQRTPVSFAWKPDKFGHVWTSPETPSYTATLANQTDADLSGTLHVTTRSYDGTETSKVDKPVALPKGGAPVTINVPVAVKLNGYHDITAALEIGGRTWTEKRSFTRLAPDTRSVKWTDGKGALFGYWSYGGGHYTPKGEYHVDLMTIAGARAGMMPTPPPMTDLVKKHWGRVQGSPYIVAPQEFLGEDNPDPAKIEKFKQEVIANVNQWEKDLTPEMKPDHEYFYAEAHISSRLTAGNFPEYFGDPPFVYTDEEKKRLKMFMETTRIGAETLKAAFPGRKMIIEYGDPLFPIPLMRAGFPKNLIDGSGLDVPSFERLPEMQLKDNAVHRLYQLKKEYEKFGIAKPQLQAVEGTFVPTEPGSCTWREQMDYYNRWSLIDMAYGVNRFYAGWFAFDCGNYYGSEHYGGCGIQRRIPYCDPKPAYAAFATMTDKLNEANFDGWLKTGSLTTFCLRFKHETRGLIYALWTIRGKRPATVTLNADGKAFLTDVMNNTKELTSQNKQVTFTTDPSVVYVTFPAATGAIESVSVGEPDNSDVKPAEGAKLVADLGDGSWRYTDRHDKIYENNHWGFYPAAGKFSAAVVSDPQHGKVLASKIEKQDRVRELMPWYNVLKPSSPIPLAGAPSHLGIWVKGASDWGRVIYILRDAKGERWIGIGTKDDYNCDDTHSWSSFNFDGWRYLRFELPGHTGWDSFRKAGSTWWRSNVGTVTEPDVKPGDEKDNRGDNIVDLPVKLEEMIIEQRSHILFVNDVQPVASDTVCFGKLYAEYETPRDATEEAVRESRLRMPMPTGMPDLPNPIGEMTRDGVGAPTKITGLKAPEHWYDGTRMHVNFNEAPGAKAYFLWVSAHADGRGAVNMVPTGIKPGDLVLGLRPGIKLYYWVTWQDAAGKMSKPSPAHEEITVDNFKEK
jgi:hypothetical protein